MGTVFMMGILRNSAVYGIKPDYRFNKKSVKTDKISFRALQPISKKALLLIPGKIYLKFYLIYIIT